VFYISEKYKIKKEIKYLIKMTKYKSNWRKKLETAPKLRKWYWDKSPGVLTISALRDLLFNNENF
jgi:hypothetical protein